jgi:hypothetical protein
MMPCDREFDYRTDLFLRFVGAGAGSDAAKRGVGNFLGLTQLAEARHVLSHLDGLPFRVSQCPRAVFSSQSLAVRARDAFGRRLCRFPGHHPQPALG